MLQTRAFLLFFTLVAAGLAGCAAPANEAVSPPTGDAMADTTPAAETDMVDTGASYSYVDDSWPNLNGTTLTILDHGAFAAFDDAAASFHALTGATVVHVEADDTGSALNRAAQEAGNPTFDVIYGIDNILWARANELDIFEPYTPVSKDRIAPDYLFFDHNDGAWPATPVDHGYIAINYDANHSALSEGIADLDALAEHADLFVTQDPRTSTPGLGFLLATIASQGEDGWQAYWQRLFDNGLLVTSGWTEAYENHFSAGYGADYGGLADKPIVTSYSESPAYEAFFGRPADQLAHVLLADQATFHQIQTMGIAKGTTNLAAAQAWIEFTLSDDFQALAAAGNAVYPVVAGVDVAATYGGHDPAPGSFVPADLSAATIGANLEAWVAAWVELCEANDCA